MGKTEKLAVKIDTYFTTIKSFGITFQFSFSYPVFYPGEYRPIFHEHPFLSKENGKIFGLVRLFFGIGTDRISESLNMVLLLLVHSRAFQGENHFLSFSGV